MARVGRRLKLTDAVIDDIASAISIGATEEIAAGYAHISWFTFYDWMRQGKALIERAKTEPTTEPSDKEALFIKLVKVIEQARAEAGVKWLQVVESAANKDPQWASWMLSKKFPKDFGTTRQEITGADGAPLATATVIILPDNGRGDREAT